MKDILFDLNQCMFLYRNLSKGILICISMFALPYLIYAGLIKLGIWETQETRKRINKKQLLISPPSGKTLKLTPFRRSKLDSKPGTKCKRTLLLKNTSSL